MTSKIKRPYILNSKSIKLGLRCTKAFWYQVNSEKGEADRLYPYYKLAQQQVKSSAMQGFEVGIDLAYDLDATIIAIRSITKPQTFKNAYLEFNGLCIRLEALIFDGKEWSSFQVKRSLNIKQKHKLEANILTHITEHLLLPNISFFALYLNKAYSPGSSFPLFKSKQITASKEGVADIAFIHPELIRISKESVKPEVEIGEHCGEHGLCPFYKKCFKTEAPSIFSLRLLSSAKAIEYYQTGVVKIPDLKNEKSLSSFQKIQKSSLNKEEIFFAKGPLNGFLNNAEFPIAFIDFEGYQATIPELKHHHPMTTVPFLFSMHLWKEPNSDVTQHIHINLRESKQPEKDFCEALIKSCSGARTFVVFNKMFETDIINRLIHLEPVYAVQLNAIKSRLLDFQEVFEKPWAYHPAQSGSISLKAVSDAFLTEKVFEESWIKNGLQACKGYEHLRFVENQEELNEIIEALKAYCGADTYSMYLLWKELTFLLKNQDASL